MKKHTKLYLSAVSPDHCEGEFLPCEICYQPMVDVHHIHSRGMGGSDKDCIENLMGLCRYCHEEYGDKKSSMDYLISEHFEYLRSLNVEFNEKTLKTFKKTKSNR